MTAFMLVGACTMLSSELSNISGTWVEQNSIVEMLKRISPAVMMKYCGSCQNIDNVFSGVTWSVADIEQQRAERSAV